MMSHDTPKGPLWSDPKVEWPRKQSWHRRDPVACEGTWRGDHESSQRVLEPHLTRSELQFAIRTHGLEVSSDWKLELDYEEAEAASLSRFFGMHFATFKNKPAAE